jgi:formimidoylglutamate deiminase
MSDPTSYLLERGWVDGAVHDDVLVAIEAGRFSRVELPGRNSRFPAEISAGKRQFPRWTGESVRLPGLTLPGLANCHSHAFHRALRGRTQRGAGTFWTWREQMYDVAGRLDPDTYRDLATATFTEMVAAGITTVGEFHYLHHRPDGTPYDDPNALAVAVAQGAIDAGMRIVLIPAAYHRGGHPRFHDADLETFLARVDALRDWAAARDDVSVAVAAHSVRAVPPDWLEAIAGYASDHGMPRHIHAAEQPREVRECRSQHGASPIELLHRTGFLGPRTSVIHAIHVDERDVELLAETETIVVTCPTTEGNLGDGHLPALAYRDAGVRLAIGSDSQVRVDPFEEVRELETGARRDGMTRRALLAHYNNDLWSELVRNGLASLGFEAGATIDVDLDHPDLHGIAARELPLALATCASAGIVCRQARRLRAGGGSGS